MSEALSIEQRLRRLEDRDEIHQLFVDYGQHLDAGDFASYADLFAADGEVRLGPMGSAKGRDEIRALMERALAGVVGTSYHLITSPRVQIAGDTATSEVMWTVVQRGPDGTPVVAMIGRHRDELVREDGRWCFRLRRGYVDIPSAMPTEEG
ncbi:MAG: hypothetical protein AMXMBFR46_11060 [Acidimicrobiia bacterium]